MKPTAPNPLPHLPTPERSVAAAATKQVMSSAFIHLPSRDAQKIVRLSPWGLAAAETQLIHECATIRLARESGALQIDGRAALVAYLERIRELVRIAEHEVDLIDDARISARPLAIAG